MRQTKVASVAAVILLACSIIVLSGANAAARGGFGGYYRYAYAGPGWSHNQSFNRTAPGQVSGMRSFQTPGGRGATRSFNRSCSSGSCTHNVTTTTNSGKTWSRSRSITANNGTVSRSSSRTGPNASVTRNGSCTSGAGCSSTVSATGPAGNTVTGQRSLTPNGQGGFTRDATYTNPNGTVTHSYTIP